VILNVLYGLGGGQMKNKAEFEEFISGYQVNEDMAYPPLVADLFSIYKYIRENRVVSVLEFGCGWSSLVIAEALRENYELHSEFFLKEVRHPNPFQLLSVDTSSHYISIAKSRLSTDLLRFAVFHQSECKMSLVKDQIAHLYSDIPPWTADLVYLDGPDCDHVTGEINGFTVNFGDIDKPYGLPMSGDLIRLEPFFWPGSHILTDGRGANAFFLRSNFTRAWTYKYDVTLDQHHFHLDEEPWGTFSAKLIRFKNELEVQN